MKNSNWQEGFTLIEVLIAIFLLTIGILAAGSMQISSLGGNSLANRVTEASTWAGDTIETLMARPYDQITTHTDLLDDNGNGVAGLNDTDTLGSLADGGPIVHGDFTVFWNVADNDPIINCKHIRVIVRRSDKGFMKNVAVDYIKVRSN